MAENRRDEASERNDEVFSEYGSGGRDIKFVEIEGVKEGTSPAQANIGKPGDGAPVYT